MKQKLDQLYFRIYFNVQNTCTLYIIKTSIHIFSFKSVWTKVYAFILPFFSPFLSLVASLSEIRERFGGVRSLDCDELSDVEEPVSDSESDAEESNIFV